MISVLLSLPSFKEASSLTTVAQFSEDILMPHWSLEQNPVSAIFRTLAFATLIALTVTGSSNTSAAALNLSFEDGMMPTNATTYGNVDIVTGITKGGVHLPCYEGTFCLRIAPGQGPRNHDAGITFDIPNIQIGDVISFWYVVVPEVNNDFAGLSLSGPGFFDWREVLGAETWTLFSYTVPDLGGGGPSLMSAVPSSSEWHIAVWVENIIGDSNRTALWIDQVGIARIPEPTTPLLMGAAFIALGLSRRQQ